MRKLPVWVRPVFIAGAALNLLLAACFLFFPALSHVWFFNAAPFIPAASLQAYALLLATLGFGYLLSGVAPLGNTAVPLMGIAAKLLLGIFLPLQAGSQFWQFPATPLWTLACLLWSCLLLLILYYIAKSRQAPQNFVHTYQEPISRTLSRFRTQRGKSLLQLSNERPTLVVFLRHFGSTFCRETLSDIQKQRNTIEAQGTQLVLVHLTASAGAVKMLEKWNLADLHHISDPNGIMHAAFGLKRSKFSYFFSWQSYLRRLGAGFWTRHSMKNMQNTAYKMPGAFLVSKGEVVRSFRHRPTDERPGYRNLTSEQAA